MSSRNRNRNSKGLTKKQFKQVKRVMLSDSETKHTSYITTASPIGTFASGNWVSQELTLIAQGSGTNQRVGQEIRVKSLEVRYAMCLPVASALPALLFRVIICYPKRDSDDNPGVAPNAINYNDPVDPDLWTVLYDRKMSISTAGPGTKDIIFNKRFKGLGRKVDYTGAGSADVSRPRLFIHFVGDSGTIGSQPILDGFTRIWYKDS